MSEPIILITDCRGIGGLLFGHNYRPRYSVVESPSGIGFKTGSYEGPSDFVRSIAVLTNKTYHGDVCVRCGHTVNQPASRSSETASLP